MAAAPKSASKPLAASARVPQPPAWFALLVGYSNA
jgi:hypothetical protein